MSRNMTRRRAKTVEIDTGKIAKLVRLLASDKDGEVLATVGALTRVLQAGGRDWHDVAAIVESGLRPAQPTGSNLSRSTWGPPDPDPGNWQSLAWFAHYHGRDLPGYFVSDMLLGVGDEGRIRASAMHELRRIVASLKTTA
jgi:hypothetical protein